MCSVYNGSILFLLPTFAINMQRFKRFAPCSTAFQPYQRPHPDTFNVIVLRYAMVKNHIDRASLPVEMYRILLHVVP